MTLEYAGDSDRLFLCLCRSLDRHVFSLLSWECTRGQGHGGEREIVLVIHGRIKKGYLCFTYTPVSTVEFCFSLVERTEGEFQERERSV